MTEPANTNGKPTWRERREKLGASESALETLTGELLSFTVRGQGFWGVGSLRITHDAGGITVVGSLLGASPGDTLEVSGHWANHPKWGRQFQVKTSQVVLAKDVRGVVAWLAAKLPQVSLRRAEALVQALGVEGVWDVLGRGDVVALCEFDGITPERAASIIEAYTANRADRDRVVWFKQIGLTDSQIGRVLEKWPEDAEKRIRENPYDLMKCVPGFGWARSDLIARKMGLALDAPPRLAAGLMHGMNEARTNGHVYVPQGKLASIVAGEKICAVDEQLVRDELEQVLGRKELVRLGVNVYLPSLAQAEGRLARAFAYRAVAQGAA